MDFIENFPLDAEFDCLFIDHNYLIDTGTRGTQNRNNYFQLRFHYYLDVYEFITGVSIIGLLQKWYQRKALSLSFKKVANDSFLKFFFIFCLGPSHETIDFLKFGCSH